MIDLVDMKAYAYDGDGRDNCREIPIPDELAEQAQEYREKLMDEVAEGSDALMERYLEGEEISHEEIVDALKEGTNHGAMFPVTCGVATRNLATNRLLDAIVEDLPSPVKHGGLEIAGMTLEAVEDADLYAYVFKTRADPFAGRINLFRVYQGVMKHDSQVLNTRAHAKERIGQLLAFSGRETEHVDEFGPGDIGAVAKLKETRAGDWLGARDEPIEMPSIELPAPVMAFAIEPKTKGDEDKVFTALRRLQEEDPTIDLHRDEQTGEQIVAGLSQVHVEVVIARLQRALRRRGRAQAAARPLPGDDPRRREGPRAPQEAERRPRAVRRLPHRDRAARGRGEGFEFVNEIKGGVIPTSFIPAVEKGVREAMAARRGRRLPGQGRARAALRRHLPLGRLLRDGVQARRLARDAPGARAGQPGAARADHARDRRRCPEDAVGDVIGDLNSRRGRPLGMEPSGAGDRGARRGADGRDALLRARPALDHGRAGRVHDGARCATRRSPATSPARSSSRPAARPRR